MARYPRASDNVSTLSDRVYSALVEKARGLSHVVHPLHVGDTYLAPMAGARAEDQLSANSPRLHNYAPVQGEPVLLDAIVSRLQRSHGVHVDREALQVMSGATGGLSVVATTLLDPGDDVLVLSPFWPLIRGIVASRGARAVELPFYDRLGAAGFDPEAALEAALTERTVALYVNSPNNPSGRILDAATQDVIERFVLRHDLWLVTDEAYEDLFYVERPQALWARPGLRERAVACHTLSKSYGLAGARVGYTHGPREIMAAVRGAQTFLTYCAPRPLQHAAAHALTHGDGWLADARAAYAEAGRSAAAALGVTAPEGGTFLFFDAAPYFAEGEDVHGFLARCLDAGVLLTPGSASGKDYQSFVRLCFSVVPPDELRTAVEKVRTVLGA